MEKTGIGRPSTYAQTLETLKKRKYILEIKKRIGASGLGEKVNQYLVSNYSELIGEKFTKGMEIELDELANGKGNKLDIIQRFYEFVKNLKTKKAMVKFDDVEKTSIKKKKPQNKGIEWQTVSNICPICNTGNVKSKFSKNGKTIYFCSRYPQCDFVSYDPIKSG
jgi:DNA topoisomerase-1